MPELPEVEVIKLFLQDQILHQQITSVDILTPKSFQGDPGAVLNKSITRLTRIGKQLSLHLSNHKILLVHLKMTGQLIYQSSDRTILGHPTKDMFTQNLPNKSTRVILTFSNQSRLFFNDQRKFGWLRVFTPQELRDFQSSLGLDIFDPKFTPQYLYSRLQKTSRPIKVALLDQSLFAGIGNIYANDALFLARIHPQTPSNLISLSESRNIYNSLVSVMQQSVLAGGSTTKDQKYRKPDGSPGGHQFHFQVYQKAGEPCPGCPGTIKRTTLAGRGTFFCPSCQKLKTKV
jgi:formamidopyrimidine-DNA glycosylase